MKFVIFIYQGTSPIPGSDQWNALSKDQQKQIYADYNELAKIPGREEGLPLGLPSASKTVQVQNGKVLVKDGTHFPEGVGGYFIIEAANIEAAIELAAKIPAARLGGAIEIRPSEKYW